MKISLSLCAALLLAASAAVANPMMTVQELRGQAVAGPHVKLTYTYNYGPDPDSATTHGKSHSPWIRVGSSNRDTGSGYKDIPILEMCDCHVPSGATLDYKITYANGYSSSVSTQVLVPDSPSGGDCTAACQLADADAADAGGRDAPLSTGEATAAGGATGTGGATTAGGTPGSGTADKSNSSGCAFLGTGTSPALLCLALLGLVIAARRRRP
jgi:hypothetical protein